MNEKHGFSWMQDEKYKRRMKQAEGPLWVDALCGCILALTFVVISLGWLG